MSASRQVIAAAAALLAGATGPALAAEKAAAFSEAKCNLCHSVAAAGVEAKSKAPKNTAPDLSGYKSSVSLDEMAAYLRKESKLDGGEHKLPFKGSDEELQAIIDWLGSLEATE